MHPTATLTFAWPQKRSGAFCALLAQGVGIPTRTGTSLYEFLCHQLGLSRDYVENDIQTIFINGSAVDCLDEVRIGHDTTVALSAAMPGLAGATLRKGGRFAGMRREISLFQVDTGPANEPTVVTLKLFNMVFRDVGPRLLSQGVWVQTERVRAMFSHWNDFEPEVMQNLKRNGQPIAPSQIDEGQWTDLWIDLRVDFFN
jgi:hypothetical protein